MRFSAILAVLLLSLSAQASTARVLDGATITNGAAVLTLPTTTDTIPGRATTDTLTNKTLTAPVLSGTVTGTYTLGGTPTIPSSALSGQTSVANGGTGASTLTSGSAVVGNGTSAVSLVAPGTSGNVFTSNGSTWTSAAPSSTAPTVSGTGASPTAVTAVGGVTFTGTAYENYAFITGSGGAVTVTASPQVAAATNIGQRLTVYGGANTVTLADGTGLSLNGAWVGGTNSALVLVWNGTVWSEAARR